MSLSSYLLTLDEPEPPYVALPVFPSRFFRHRYWDYGIERNRHVLATFARYSHEQGLARSLRTPGEIVLQQAADGYRL